MRIATIVIMLGMPLLLAAQAGLSVSGGYTGFYSSTADRIIDSYNFSRPWLTDKQPYLRAGYGAAVSYKFRLSGKLFLSPGLGMAAVTSRGTKNGFEHNVVMDYYNLPVMASWYFLMKDSAETTCACGNRLFLDAGAGLSVVRAHINSSDPNLSEWEDKYDKPSSAFKPSLFLKAGIGYHLPLSGRIAITPYGSLSWCPVQNLEGLSAVLIGSNEIGLMQKGGVFLTEMGIKVSFLVKK